MDIRQHLDERRAAVDRHLRQMLGHLDGCPAVLRDAVEYSLLAPGKRLRPLLAILGAEAGGGTVAMALPAACAVEMIHTYSLIHDDLPAMDDDDLRRGRPTSHKRFGEALALLAGDTLLTLAFEVLAAEYRPETAAACIAELARFAGGLGMVGGQADDLTMAGKISGPKVSESLSTLEGIHDRKTGALIRASLILGLIAAQGPRQDPAAREIMETFGRCFGLAFQITDDLLDVEGDANVTGKRVRKDASQGKMTFPGLLGVADSRSRAHLLARQAEESAQQLGPAGEPLAALVRLMVHRDR